MNLVLGNIVALIASILMVYCGTIKQKKDILIVQSTQIGLFALSSALLNGISGVIVNILGFVRNILCYYDKLGKKEKVILIVLSGILIFLFNNKGVIGLLPLVSTAAYISFMDIKNVVHFKILITFTLVMWIIYDIYIGSYTSALFYFFSIITNSISIIKLHNELKK